MKNFTRACHIVLIVPKLLFAQDLEIQNLDWEISYSESSGVVSGVLFKPAEGDGVDITDDFVISLNAENLDDNSVTELARQTVSGGIPSFNAISANNWGDIDLNSFGLPAGKYLIVAVVDTDDDISESNESNNSMYLATSEADAFQFNPSGGGGGGNVGIDQDVTLPSLKAYPNPASDVLLIETGSMPQIGSSLKIIDVTGRTVYTDNTLHLLTTVPVHNLENGIYTYSIESNGFVHATGKFVKATP